MKENKLLPPVKERSLKKTLSYMNGNVLCKACDFLNGTIVVVCFVGMLWIEDKNEWFKLVLMALGTLLWSVVLHFILTYIDEKWRRYVEWMLFYSKEYSDYGDAEAFEALVDASLKEDMIFRTRRLVLTKDIMLGCMGEYNGFKPVVIWRKDVASASFYEEEHWNWTRRDRRIYTLNGIWELRLKNGNTIKLWVSEGRNNNKRMRELLLNSRFNE